MDKTITSSFQHAVSDIFIIMISERAPLEIYIFPCLRKYPARRTARERSDRAGGRSAGGGGGVPSQGRENFAFGARKTPVSDTIYLGKDY